MNYTKTGFKDLWLCEPAIYGDARGYFFEAFNQKEFGEETGLQPQFVQQNQSSSDRGVLRGLHLQKGSEAQAKLIRVIQGTVFDVVVDLRRDEPTFGKSYTVELSGKNKKQLFIPKGFAHGFLVLEDDTVFTYSCDNFYKRESELTLKYNDPEIDIVWPEISGITLSEKDKQGLDFETLVKRIYD